MTNHRTIQPDARKVIVGVDTHTHVHVAVAIDTWGIRLGDRSCAADSDGYQQLITWAERHGRVAAFGIEGTGSYGAGLARAVRRAGHQVLEVNRGDRRTRRIAGKSDAVDAETAARSVLAGQSTAIPKTADGAVEMMRHLKVARRTAVKARTSAMITLKQIVVTAPPALRETLHPLADQALLKRCRGLSDNGPLDLGLGAQLAISVKNCPPPRDPRSRMTSFKRTQRKYVQKAYRVRNWREYETGLRARGSLTVWLGLTDGKLANWNSPRPTRRKPGRQRKYSNHAVETTVTLGLVFGLASRQTEGFLRSLLTLLNLDNDVPDHSTISRRKARLGKVASSERRTVKPVHLLIDSSGLSVHVGQLRTPPKARDSRKLHLAVDEQTSDVVACELTSKRARDASRVASLVGQIERPIASAKADAAYDTGDVYKTLNGVVHQGIDDPEILRISSSRATHAPFAVTEHQPQPAEPNTAFYLRQLPNDRRRHTRPSHERRL